MERSDHLGALTDRCGYAFDGTRAHIANRKYAMAVRLQGMTPFAGVAPGANKALPVQVQAAFSQPIGVGIGANEQKQMLDGSGDFVAACAMAPAHLLQSILAAVQGNN